MFQSTDGHKWYFKIWSSLIIHKFWICKFMYWLKFICNLTVNTHDTFEVIWTMRNFHHLTCMFPCWDFDSDFDWGRTLTSCFSSHTENKSPCYNVFTASFWSCLCFAIHGVAKSRTRLSDWTDAFRWWFHCLKWAPSESWSATLCA